MTSHDHHQPDPPRWADQHDLLLTLARHDISVGQAVVPTLVAFAGSRPLVVITLRPFERRGHEQALIEVGMIADLLGADRLLLSLSGRAWSTRDPIPPVIDDERDLRQRVVVLHEALADGEQVIGRCAVYPLQDAVGFWPDHGVAPEDTLGDPITTDDPEGWVSDLLRIIVTGAGERPPQKTQPTVGGVRVADVELAHQVLRCEELGHRFAWGPSVHARLHSAFQLLEAQQSA